MAKPRKVEEPAGTYSASPKRDAKTPDRASPSPAVSYMDEKTFRKSADKVFKVHKDLLRRLAQ